MKSIIRFFDKLEDHVRKSLSRSPIVYAFLGGIGVVLFWRGVWHTADMFFLEMPFDGPLSILLGSILLLITGLFVSVFIGDEVLISGLRGDKKLTEKTQMELEKEKTEISKIHDEMHGLSKRIANLEKTHSKKIPEAGSHSSNILIKK